MPVYSLPLSSIPTCTTLPPSEQQKRYKNRDKITLAMVFYLWNFIIISMKKKEDNDFGNGGEGHEFILFETMNYVLQFFNFS